MSTENPIWHCLAKQGCHQQTSIMRDMGHFQKVFDIQWPWCLTF